MFAKLSVRNFKGIGSLDIDDFARVNLFIGKNDTGKSTIMEAIYYLCHELYAPPQLSLVMSRRTDVFTGVSELWFGYNRQSEIVVRATFGSTELCWKIVPEGPARDAFHSYFYQSTGGSLDNIGLGGTDYRGNFSITGTRERMVDGLQVDEKTKQALSSYVSYLSLVDCTMKSRTTEVERILGKLKIDDKDASFGQILNDIYGKGKEWEFVPHPEDPNARRLVFKESGRLRYFSDFGDGLRCCVGILGTAMTLENTGLCVEEIESHQHSGSLSKLIRHLVEISHENNLQIFLSTHSMDVWESLHRGVYKEDETKEKNEFRCFLIERNAETGKVTPENTYDIQKITNALK